MKKIGIILAATGLLVLPVAAQSVTKLAATKANEYGLAYSLPQTVVDIKLQAQCTVRTPGEFYNYAERYLGRDAAAKAVKDASTSWVITGAELTVRSTVPQNAEQYLMQLKGGGTPVFVMLSDQGAPLAINTETVEMTPAVTSQLAPAPLTASPLDSPAARYAVTEDMVASSSAAKRAQLAADQIMQLRQSRQDYLTGQADAMPDGKALEMILANINAQEEALTAMFLGTVQTRSEVMSATYVPAANSQADVVIARLNARTGFVDADDLSGAPVYLQYAVTRRGEMPVTDKGEVKKFPKGGIPYCIPGDAAISLDYDGRVLLTQELSVAQLGVVFGLDPSFFTNKKEPGYATFDPLTGALRHLGTK